MMSKIEGTDPIPHTHSYPATNRMPKDKVAHPQDVYRIVQAVLDSLDDPEAFGTIRHELRTLINDILPVSDEN